MSERSSHLTVPVVLVPLACVSYRLHASRRHHLPPRLGSGMGDCDIGQNGFVGQVDLYVRALVAVRTELRWLCPYVMQH